MKFQANDWLSLYFSSKYIVPSDSSSSDARGKFNKFIVILSQIQVARYAERKSRYKHARTKLL